MNFKQTQFIVITICALGYGAIKFIDSKPQTLPKTGEIQVCFTPNKVCQRHILEMINSANSSIKIHAFSFTDPDIGRALQNAQARGVKIQLLLDKTNRTDKNSLLRILQNIEYKFDYVPGIAHSKVMLIDDNIAKRTQYVYVWET